MVAQRPRSATVRVRSDHSRAGQASSGVVYRVVHPPTSSPLRILRMIGGRGGTAACQARRCGERVGPVGEQRGAAASVFSSSRDCHVADELGGVETDGAGNVDELDDIKAAFPALVLGDERLGLTGTCPDGRRQLLGRDRPPAASLQQTPDQFCPWTEV